MIDCTYFIYQILNVETPGGALGRMIWCRITKVENRNIKDVVNIVITFHILWEI
jgi:hypothetical protein